MAIQRTKEYNMFRWLKGNREIDESHLARLKKRIKDVGVLQPILVNNDMEILDGQHRFYAAKFLGYEIPYINVGDLDIDDVITMNMGTKKWVMEDFLNKEVELGNEDYIKLKEIYQKYGVLLRIAIFILAKSKSIRVVNEAFQSGKLIRKMEWTELEVILQKISKFDVSSHYGKRNFQQALLDVMEVEGFNYDRMVHNFHKHYKSTNPLLKLTSNTKIGYKMWLSNIYNYGKQERNRLELITSREMLTFRNY